MLTLPRLDCLPDLIDYPFLMRPIKEGGKQLHIWPRIISSLFESKFFYYRESLMMGKFDKSIEQFFSMKTQPAVTALSSTYMLSGIRLTLQRARHFRLTGSKRQFVEPVFRMGNPVFSCKQAP